MACADPLKKPENQLTCADGQARPSRRPDEFERQISIESRALCVQSKGIPTGTIFLSSSSRPNACLSLLGQTMNHPILTIEERQNIESGAWFCSIPQELQTAILGCAQVRRLQDGAMLAARGQAAEDWIGVARGAVRVSSVSLAGKQVALTYVEPGTWFGDIALFDGLPRTHDATAHGETTLLVVRKADFRDLLGRFPQLYEALLRLNCRRLRLMFNLIEDLNTKPLAARLAKQLLLLAKSYGIAQGEEIRIGLQLAQEDLAQLLGASRQRVNQELKELEREGVLRVEPARLIVLSRDKLMAACER